MIAPADLEQEVGEGRGAANQPNARRQRSHGDTEERREPGGLRPFCQLAPALRAVGHGKDRDHEHQRIKRVFATPILPVPNMPATAGTASYGTLN